jgi:serine/threonine protein kinase
MNQNGAEEPPAEDRLGELILEYLDALQAGQEFDRGAFLRAQPKFCRDLEAFFAGHDQVERLAAPLRAGTPNTPDGETPSRTGIGRRQFAAAESRARQTTPALGQLGEFRLLREVGRGGMGVVYEADQISLQRRVALKVLPLAAAIDDRRLQRFKNEALAAAHLRHEHIVPVHAIGTDLGVHYYAMQFIEGQSLAALIGELRGLTGEAELPRASPPIPEPGAETAGAPVTRAGDASHSAAVTISRDLNAGSRKYFDWVAGLGRQAAEALEHAHQMGIVHRDIKPANLLLDPRGQLWVTDFGLAQFSGDAGLTMTGDFLGTLRYASPEQIRARSGLVDHRTDIYSLGATLYELLTLRPLFEGRDRNELLRQIADEEPRPPRSIRPAGPEDLETVVLKALAKEPAERYATAQDMAADLQRFLENRPILARRPTLAERLRKWARRHPAVVLAGGVLLLLACAGSLIVAALLNVQKAEQIRRRQEADARFQFARRAVDEMIQVSELELSDGPQFEALRQRLLELALAYYQGFVEQHRCDSTVQHELEETKRRVEVILADLKVLQSAGELRLLRERDVVDDIGVSAEPRSEISRMLGDMDRQFEEGMHDLHMLTPEERHERRQRLVQSARDTDGKVRGILTTPQLSRLHQIALQLKGPRAFREPEVAAALKLTAQQSESIRAIVAESFSNDSHGPRSSVGTSGGRHSLWGSLEMFRNERESHSREGRARILALLTPAQTSRWQEIAGAPYEGHVPRGPYCRPR